MEKRIKPIFILTIIAAVTVIAAQIYWLFNQYLYSLQQLENDLYAKTLNIAEADKQLRSRLQNKNLQVITHTNIGIEQNNSASDTKINWTFKIYIIDDVNTTYAPASIRYDSLYIDSLYKAGKDIKKHQFTIAPSDRNHDVYNALDRFLVNEKCPFTTERLDSLLRAEGLTPTAIQVETTDSTVWNSGRINHSSIFNPVLEVTYPFNILQQQQFRVSYHLNVWAIFEKLFLSLIGAVILSFLLIFCLIYQINTIFKQQRIEKLRKNFIYTIIHELNRPIMSLKLCVSFMKNEQMMQDKEMKEEILKNSRNELDSLASYFSKLRDVMADDLETIPLNLSTFNLKTLVEQYVDKQLFSTNKAVDITTNFEGDDFEITADKMYIANILSNLLENAVKYSEGNTLIRIDCRSVGDKYRLEIADNGFGIAETECKYVFDRFFRSANVVESNIPGIGLGLYYVKQLVNAHNGSIALESTPGKGSTFIIEIPKKQ